MGELNEGIAYHTSKCPQVSYSATSCECGFVQKFLARDKSVILPCPKGKGGNDTRPTILSQTEPIKKVDISEILKDAARRAAQIDLGDDW